MLSKDLREYLIYAIRNRFYTKKSWHIDMFTIVDGYSKFVKTDGNNLHLLDVSGKTLVTVKSGATVFKHTDEVKIGGSVVINIKGDTDITTTVGRVVSNLIMLVEAYGSRFEFINKMTNFKDVIDKIAPSRMVDLDVAVKGDITHVEYERSSVCSGFIAGLSGFIVHSSSRKLISEPTGITEFKTKITKEMIAEHGVDDFMSDTIQVLFKDRLLAFDREFMSDDPTFNVTYASTKLTARQRLFLTIGFEKGFDNGEAVAIANSLSEGWPNDPKSIATLNNMFKSGSYDRGASTADTGDSANQLNNASINLSIDNKDCGVTYGLRLNVTINNYSYLKGCSIIVNKKSTRITSIEDAKKLIGSEIEMRSPMWCKSSYDQTCITCFGDAGKYSKSAPVIVAAATGGKLLYTTMKAMHGKDSKIRVYTIDDIFN